MTQLSRVRGRGGSANPSGDAERRLPVRWALIAVIAGGAAVVGYIAEGPLSAFAMASSAAQSAHALIA
jgi:hypothetical protein